MKRLATAILFLATAHASAVIVFDQHPNLNLEPPAEFGGQWPSLVKWQLCQGTAISPYHFLTAAHVGGSVGDRALLYGGSLVLETVSVTIHPDSDLAIWEVSTPFPTWSDAYRGSGELGMEAWMFGRGAQKGVGLYGKDGELDGWKWGRWDGAMRWGVNTIEDVSPDWLWTDFDPLPGECMLMGGDSGGPLYIQKDDRWWLAGINVAVDGGYSLEPGGPQDLYAILFDPEGWYLDGEPAMEPSRSWSYRLSNYADWIDDVTGRSVPEPAGAALVAALAILALAHVLKMDL